MRFIFTGKDMTASESLKQKAQKKLARLEKLVPENAEIHVTFIKSRHQYKVEVSVPLHKRMLRAEVSGTDPALCLDSVADILEQQSVKYKTRLRERKRRDAATHEELSYIEENGESEGENGGIVINRTKRFALKPMDAHEAVMEMEMLGHSFYVFRSSATEEVCVVYKRNDGEYGLIEPQ